MCFASVSPHLDAIKTAVSSRGDQLTPREHAYIRAVLAYASGSLLKAVEEFSNILLEYPLGIVALKSCGYQAIIIYKYKH